GTDGKDIGYQPGSSSGPNPPNPPAPPDPPSPTLIISGVTATNITASSASILWTTNTMSDSQVEYGPTTSYGSQTPLKTTLVTSHLDTVMGLNAGAEYHYRVKSRDASGKLVVSGDLTFKTSSNFPSQPPSGAQPVVWTQLVQAAANGATLTKIAGCAGCESTAVSQQSMTGEDG